MGGSPHPVLFRGTEKTATFEFSKRMGYSQNGNVAPVVDDTYDAVKARTPKNVLGIVCVSNRLILGQVVR